MFLQPLHVAETRFVTQNRSSNFAAYQSIVDFIKNTPVQDMLRANMMHLPRNFLVALQGLKLTDQISMTSYYLQIIASQTLAYPFLLMQRRKECFTSSQSLQGRGFPGLDSEKFGGSSMFSIAKRILAEEGPRGFYKGYLAYMFAIVFWAAALPASTDVVLSISPYIQSIRSRKSREELLEQ